MGRIFASNKPGLVGEAYCKAGVRNPPICVGQGIRLPEAEAIVASVASKRQPKEFDLEKSAWLASIYRLAPVCASPCSEFVMNGRRKVDVSEVV